MAARATWNGVVLAESDRTVRVEGNYYFPPDSLNREYFRDSRAHTLCPWKGRASYYTVVVDGLVNPDAAWYYPRPSPLARRIRGHVAFWRGVDIEVEPSEDRNSRWSRLRAMLTGSGGQRA